LEWLLVAHLPRREVTAPLIAQFGWTALIFLGLSAVWVVLAWALLRRDLRLTRLEADLERLQELRRKDEQLLHAEKLATVGVLVSGLAHEIGTPLGIISMRLQLLRRKTADGDDDRRTLDTALEQLDRVTGLIRQLLDFARSRPGAPQRVLLHQAAGAVRDLVAPLSHRRRTSLVFEVPSDLPAVSGTPDGLQQIVLNLVMNALQAVEENGRVTVSACAEGDDVLLLVDDNGPGIPEEHRAAVFDPFYTTKRQGEGSGLGLTVVLGLVRRMEGELRVGESPLGGARFEVRLKGWRN
jgi:signal transduction histidine kinase